MSEFDFKSQICTTREQSERLLALGLKKETADMTIHIKDDGSWYVTAEPFCEWEDDRNTFPSLVEPEPIVPAWSLHRLLSLIEYDDGFIDVSLREGRYGIHYGYDDEWYDNLYDAVISCIQALIEEKDFNKEYLV